jgi:hypothetical protein
MKHVNKYQTTQSTKKSTEKKSKEKNTHTEKITGVNQSITPDHHIQ